MSKKIKLLPFACLLLLINLLITIDIFAQTKKKKSTSKKNAINIVNPVDNVYGTYKLTQVFSEDKIQTEELKFSEMILTKKDSSLKLYVGCNRIMGTAILKNDSISIQQMISTEMYCNDNVQTIEEVVKGAIQKVNNLKYMQKKVYLYENEKLLIIASKMK